ncbi:MAG: hypothetical protein RLN70_01635, partial [Rhodospirillaceae bacterium]
MLGLILRIFVAVTIISVVVLLFAVSVVAALVATPIILLLLFFLGRRHGIQVWTVRTGNRHAPHQGRREHGPVIDHD